MADKRSIGIRQLKNQASRILDEVRERDEEYVVTKRGEPVAVLRPWNADDERANRAHRARQALAALSDIAERVALASGQRGARAVVSEQRR